MEGIASRSSPSSTITARAELPLASAKELRKRQATTYPDLWNTCGYISDDLDNAQTCGPKGSCFCQTASDVMGHCFPAGISSSCQYFTTCSDGILEGFAVSYGGSADALSVCSGARGSCQYLTWTNQNYGQFAWQCGSDDSTVELAFYSTMPTRTTTKSSTGRETSSTSSSTLNSSGSATSPSPSAPTASNSSGGSQGLSTGAIAAIVVGAVLGVAALVAIIIWILHHRKTKEANRLRLSNMAGDTNGPGPAPYAAAIPRIAEPAEKNNVPLGGLSMPASPVPGYSPHQSIGVSSSAGSQDRLSPNPSAYPETGRYTAYTSDSVPHTPSNSNRDFVQMLHSGNQSMDGQTWLANNRASELPASSTPSSDRHMTAISELSGSNPRSPR